MIVHIITSQAIYTTKFLFLTHTMSIENREPMPSPPIYEIDLSAAWDTESQAELFIEQLKKLNIYKSNLRFTGFNGSHIGKKFASNQGENIIFCSEESDLFSGSGGENENSIAYALSYDKPAVAIYDGDKIEKNHEHAPYGYNIKDPSALIAIIRLK